MEMREDTDGTVKAMLVHLPPMGKLITFFDDAGTVMATGPIGPLKASAGSIDLFGIIEAEVAGKITQFVIHDGLGEWVVGGSAGMHPSCDFKMPNNEVYKGQVIEVSMTMAFSSI